MLNPEEKSEIQGLLRQVATVVRDNCPEDQYAQLKELWRKASACPDTHDDHRLPRLAMRLDMAATFAGEVSAEGLVIASILLSGALQASLVAGEEEVRARFGDDTALLATRMAKVEAFAAAHTMGHQENYSGLLLALSDDIRVVMALIVRSLVLMRRINLHPDQEWVREVATEARVLYSELAHRLGLYGIKSVLEDLWLKYTDRPTYKEIARRLSQTKRSRDAYIARFIGPVSERLQAAGLRFTIKGRTKSIFSIWNKVMNKKVDMDHIYDLFAIRVIVDSPPEREKSDCWLGYSILANMYRPDPDRMRDWLSFPKSNGYESLHITVLGPEDKWVEVQFRSRRMDLVAEKGLAAHWRYKGGKASAADRWMNRVRDVLEQGAPAGAEAPWHAEGQQEVYAFTPGGDLLRLPPQSTLLDFAFAVHTAVGCRCTGGNVNGRYEKISYRLRSGDTVKILTSPSQTPKKDWLQLVQTSKARTKIRQSLDEARRLRADLGREVLERRLRNRKIQVDESELSRLILKTGYKFSTDFFADVADGKIDISRFLDQLKPEAAEEAETAEPRESADGFVLQRPAEETADTDTLIIGGGQVRGMRHELARCCSPHPGDPVFGFISAEGIIKVHRDDCPNAFHIRARYPYRIIGCRWAGDTAGAIQATVRIIGRDDIGIVTNLTSLIDKEKGVSLASVQINSADGLFTGFLGIRATGRDTLGRLLRKMAGVKGIKQVQTI